jgi:hypothetical protein
MIRHPWLNVVTPIVLALGLLFVAWSPLAALATPNQPAGPAAAPGAGPALVVTPTLGLSSPLELEPDSPPPAVQPAAQPQAGYRLYFPLLAGGSGPTGRAGAGPLRVTNADPV